MSSMEHKVLSRNSVVWAYLVLAFRHWHVRLPERPGVVRTRRRGIGVREVRGQPRASAVRAHVHAHHLGSTARIRVPYVRQFLIQA
jgi:hypothetical protein